MEAESAAIETQAKGHLVPPEAGTSRNSAPWPPALLPGASEESLCGGLPASRTTRE